MTDVMSATPVILVVDDDPSVRGALQRMLQAANFATEMYASAQELLQRGIPANVGCMLLDLRMPGVGGLELQQVLHDIQCEVPIVFMTGHGDVPTSVTAMRGGAVDFLCKPLKESELMEAINRALEHDRRLRGRRAELSEVKARFEVLTPREREVFAHVVTGRLNKQIAARLGTTEKTIKVHRARVMSKMRAGSVAELVRMADRLGIGRPSGPSIGAGIVGELGVASEPRADLSA